MHILPLLVSTILSAASMPAILYVAERRNLYDSLGARKIHTGNIPRLGGAGIFIAFFLVVLGLPLAEDGGLIQGLASRADLLVPVAVGAFLVHGIGLWDDLTGGKVRAVWKLIVQILAAVIVVGQGLRFGGLNFAPDNLAGSLRWVSSVITCVWIVGVTNAINLIDGMDGLAGGISLIASLAYSIFFFLKGDLLSAFLCLSLAGAIAGFLTANFPAPKAKLFMGDSGSLFLGFCLSVMPLLGHTGDVEMVTVGVIPATLVLFVPVYDTLRAVWRRTKAGVSIASADRLHIHHLFFDAGFRPISILAIVYGVTAVQAIIFLVASRLPQYLAFLAELIGFCGTLIVFRFAASLQINNKE